MIIVHITNSLAGGGGEQMVLQLAKQSSPTVRTIVFSITDVNTIESKFKENHIEYYFLGINSFRNKTLIKGLKKMHLIIKDLPNVVFHCHQFHGCLLGMVYKLRYSKPIVFTLHSSTVKSFSRKMLLFLTKPLRKKDIIFSSNAKQWFLKNSEIIPNGVDFKALSYNTQRQFESPNIFSFLFLGRLSDEKNPLFMISAVEHLIKNGMTNFIIQVVGDGFLYDELSKKIKTHNLDAHFNLAGFQSDIKKYLDSSHCLILPSLWEGMPIVIIEAAAAKLPIIATPVGSIPDFLNDSNATVSTLEHFNSAMTQVMQHYEEALLKSNKLHTEINSTFSIENVYNKHLHLYKSIV